MGRLENKVALITGAGGGFGRAIAQEFAREGAHIYAGDVDDESNTETVDLIAGEGGTGTAIRLDVRQKGDIAAVLDAIGQQHGRLHVLVNNAGITQREDFRHISDEQWEEILDINLTAAMRLSRDALKLLRAAEGASIINISSIMEGVHVRQPLGLFHDQGRDRGAFPEHSGRIRRLRCARELYLPGIRGDGDDGAYPAQRSRAPGTDRPYAAEAVRGNTGHRQGSPVSRQRRRLVYYG